MYVQNGWECSMRWKTKKIVHGQKRVVRRFAFLPVQLDNDVTVWFERYWEEQQWFDYSNFTLSYWLTIRAYTE